MEGALPGPVTKLDGTRIGDESFQFLHRSPVWNSLSSMMRLDYQITANYECIFEDILNVMDPRRMDNMLPEIVKGSVQTQVEMPWLAKEEGTGLIFPPTMADALAANIISLSEAHGLDRRRCWDTGSFSIADVARELEDDIALFDKINRSLDIFISAIAIEAASMSPRIVALRAAGKHCGVCPGITSRLTTKYVIIGLNPGGDETSPSTTGLSMAEYTGQSYRYQKAVKAVIDTFENKMQLAHGAALPSFGVANFSCLHSNNTSDPSFSVEAVECRELLLKELNLPCLEVLIFTGRDCRSLFTALLWKIGSEIAEVKLDESGELKKLDPKAVAIDTIIQGLDHRVRCLFTRHLSPRSPLPVGYAEAIGVELAGWQDRKISCRSE